MELNNQFIPYEEASTLKELGFDEPCLAYYEVSDKLKERYRLRYVEHEDTNPTKQPKNSDCLAPLYEQAFSWFRTRHHLMKIIDSIFYGENDDKMVYYYYIQNISNGEKLYFPTKEYRELMEKSTSPNSSLIDLALYEKNLLEASFTYLTYKEARLACLRHLIKIVKDGK